MTYVRRFASEAAHQCPTPTRDWIVNLPKGGMLSPSAETVATNFGEVPAGQLGDLWRCDWCGALWRLGQACAACDYRPGPHGGMCTVGMAWRPATLWQRIGYRRLGRERLHP